MTIDGFLTFDGVRHAVTLELPALNPAEGEAIIRLPTAEVLGHSNELTFRGDRSHDDPFGLRFCRDTEGSYGKISGNHRRADDHQIENSLVQFKLNELDRHTLRRGGEITFHCLDGLLGDGDAAMRLSMTIRAGLVVVPKLFVEELHVQRPFIRGVPY